MTYVITSKCADICDAACLDVCPVDDCIVGAAPLEEMRARKLQMFINPDECIDCGGCMSECPVDAIRSDHDAPAADLARAVAFFANRSAGGA